MNYLYCVLLISVFALTFNGWKKSEHYYDQKGFNHIIEAYAPIAPLNVADCIDCGGVE